MQQRELVEAAGRGDHSAFEALAIAAGDRLFSVARLTLGGSDPAEDAVQETLVRAWRMLPGLRDPDRFDAWLYRILIHACADLGRRSHRWAADVQDLYQHPTSGDDVSAFADRDQLERGFKRLKPSQRVIVVLRFYLDLELPDIAMILGIPLGTAKSRLHYSMDALRSALEADLRGPALESNGRPA